jgi:hypothetical protein
MKRSGLICSVVAGLLAGTLCQGVAADAARDPEAVRQAFTAVAARLDKGGDLMVVANVDGMIERSMADIVEIMSTATVDDAKAKEAMAIVKKLHAFLKKNGFYAINGLGMSSVPRADGQNVVKMFISRDAEAAMLPLWRACVGGAPRELQSIRFLPANTELARAGTADIKQLWALIQKGVSEVAPAEAAQQFAQGIEGAAKMIGTPVDQLIGSIGADSVIGIQFSSDAKITIPAGEKQMAIPSPSLLLAMQVKDDTLMALVKGQVAKMGMPLTESQVEGTTIYSMNLPVPVVPVQLAMAQHKGYLLIGTTAQTLTDAIKAYAGKGGLIATAAYKVAFAGQPAKNNGIAYVSERFGEIIRSIEESAMALAPATGAQDKASRELVQRLLDRQQNYGCAITIMNYKSGVRASGTTSASGQQLVVSMAIAPVGMMAAIAIPSFVKARQAAQGNACINNLRLLDSAKEQAAMEQNLQNGAAVDEAAVTKYLPSAAIPVCSKGGTYTLGPIGTNPTCSQPGHVLP